MSEHELSSAEKQRLFSAWKKATEGEKVQAESGRSGFLAWLRKAGLTVIAMKLAQLAWEAIKMIFVAVFG